MHHQTDDAKLPYMVVKATARFTARWRAIDRWWSGYGRCVDLLPQSHMSITPMNPDLSLSSCL
jgi:hypothetical protein